MDSANIVGYIASAVTVFTFLPQVIKTWKEKSAKNVSLLMFVIAITNEILWIAYGVMRDDMVIILTNIVMMCMASFMIYLKLRFKDA
ncbi:MAG: SemiSWEET transporter [Bacteroidota bacterium]